MNDGSCSSGSFTWGQRDNQEEAGAGRGATWHEGVRPDLPVALGRGVDRKDQFD